MVTVVTGSEREFRGLSTDDKPVNDLIPNGSIYFEMDTCKVYLFDEDTSSWVELD